MADPHRRVTPPDGSIPRTGWRRAEGRALLEITALSGLVITQPLLQITGNSPDVFLFYGVGAGGVLLLVAVVALAPPLLLWGLGVFARPLGHRCRTAVHAVTVLVLLAGLAVQAGKQLSPLRGLPLVLLAGAVAAAGGYAYRRWRVSAQVLRLAAAGPVVFVALFVFVSPASAVVLGRQPHVGAAGTGQPGAAHPPVVMLVLDELPLVSLLGPDGRIDAGQFPNFARLAAGSTWYRNATAVSGQTPYALPAMLTGDYPAGAVAPHYSQYPDNLFTLLGGVYDVRAQESITQLCPPSRCGTRSQTARGGLPALLRESGELLAQVVSPQPARRDPQSSYREVTRREAGGPPPPAPNNPQFRFGALDANQPARFVDFLAGLHPETHPTVHFLHLLLPHTPWTYLPSGMRYESPSKLANDGDGWISLAYQRHLAQLRYTDRLLGEMLDRLTQTGLYDDALVVVTADHGLSFTPGEQGRHLEQTQRSPGQVLWVPMFLKEPGQHTGRVDDRNWEEVDLLPTVADRVGVRLAAHTDGVSAAHGTRPGTAKHFYDPPGTERTFPGPSIFASVIGGTARPAVPAVGPPDLVGHRTDEFTLSEGGRATVHDLDAFGRVDPGSGRVPALVCGTAPPALRTGAHLAIAVNGRIAAVAPVVDPDAGGRRFCGLIVDDSIFRPGKNRLELFEVGHGRQLREMRI